jgi:polyhydroxyalkanoate synthesis regulator phasin
MEEIGGYKVHPAASVFPLIEGEEFEELCESIKKHGVQHPAIVRDDELIDGRNRMRAVIRLQEDGWSGHCPVKEWSGEDRNVAEWIWETNALRRHMSEDGLVYASAAIWPLIAKENEARREANLKRDAGPGRGKKKTDHTKSCERFPRDGKAEHERSTVGQVAAKAKTSQHKARQAIAVQKAVAAGELPADTAKDVMSGKKKLKDVAPKLKRNLQEKKHRAMKAILSDLRDLIAEWKNADHDIRTLRDEFKTQIERM